MARRLKRPADAPFGQNLIRRKGSADSVIEIAENPSHPDADGGFALKLTEASEDAVVFSRSGPLEVEGRRQGRDFIDFFVELTVEVIDLFGKIAHVVFYARHGVIEPNDGVA